MADLTLDDIARIRRACSGGDWRGHVDVLGRVPALLDLAEEALRAREACHALVQPWPGDDGDRSLTCCEATVAQIVGHAGMPDSVLDPDP